jgi:hypothetical protein
MKKPSSGLGVALWGVGGLLGLYVMGALAIYLDEFVFKTYYIFKTLPPWVGEYVQVIYTPLGWLIDRMGLFR